MFPPNYKSFTSICYILYNVLRDKLINDFVVQGRIKLLTIEWHINRDEWSGIFNQPFANAERIIERFLDDEAIFYFFKRRPFMF